MQRKSEYPIGTPGKKWGSEEKAQWFNMQKVQRCYVTDVVSQIEALAEQFDILNYGKLVYGNTDYPLYALKTKNWDNTKPCALVTGGVHGYETSGVHGALRFASTKALGYSDGFNLLIAPCISPWAYETINRWNPNAVDPNRSFYANSPAAESAALMALVNDLEFVMHIDLHETTDSDNSEFRPALAARDAIEQKSWEIPDGFYTVGDTENPCDDFQAAVIAAVEQVTHIAPTDKNGMIIGAAVTQPGVINYALSQLGLCASVTKAKYKTTTEVYPDSPKVDSENCILAQVAAVCGALDYVVEQG